jgi:hypothetical protein
LIKAGAKKVDEEGKPMTTERKPRFKVGQVVRINTDWYASYRKDQKYQRITDVWSWPESKKSPWGYSFVNGDRCNEKYVSALTKKELGR